MTDGPESIRLVLFIAGSAPESTRALLNARPRAQQLGPATVDHRIMDVFADPQRALGAGVVVTPMLVLAPRSRACAVAGTLDDGPLVLATLGLEPG